MAANGTLAEQSMLFDVKFTIDGRGTGLGLFRGFREFPGDASLEIYSRMGVVSYRLKMDNLIYNLKSDGVSLFIDDKTSTSHDMAYQTKAVYILDAVNRAAVLTGKELGQAGKIVHTLNRHIMPILDLSDRKRIKQINRGLQFTANTTGDTEELLFVPARDLSMAFRGIIGKDCTWGDASQLVHPDAYFYKIIQNNKWKGYVTLVALTSPHGEKALLFDVINVDTTVKVDWAGVFARFTKYLSVIASRVGWQYILIPAEHIYISNYDYIRNPIWKAFEGNRKLPKGSFRLREIEYHENIKPRKFQSVSGDFIVVWEKGNLF